MAAPEGSPPTEPENPEPDNPGPSPEEPSVRKFTPSPLDMVLARTLGEAFSDRKFVGDLCELGMKFLNILKKQAEDEHWTYILWTEVRDAAKKDDFERAEDILDSTGKTRGWDFIAKRANGLFQIAEAYDRPWMTRLVSGWLRDRDLPSEY